MTEQAASYLPREGAVPEQATSVMLIDITISRQPRQYNSVRVGVTLPVFVTPDDDVHVLLARHLAAAKETLENEVDNEFESYEEPAVYSQEPRYMLLVLVREKLAVIVPQMPVEALPGAWAGARVRCEKHRLSYVRMQAKSEWGHYHLVDCSDGDFTRLPLVDNFTWHHNQDLKMYILVRDEIEVPNLGRYPGWWRGNTALALPLTIAAELRAKALAEGATFFDCTDGDFSKLPPPPKAPEIEADDPYDEDPDDEDEFAFDDDES